MKKQKLSFPTLLQAGCSAILFISCLLPWLNITSPQEFLRGEFSLINMPVQTVSDTGIMTNTFPPVGSIFDYYRIVLYVILFFIFINIFIQLIKKDSPFYMLLMSASNMFQLSLLGKSSRLWKLS